MTAPARLRPAPVQPRSLTYTEQRARATRPDLWPTWIAGPPQPEPCPGDGDCECHDHDTDSEDTDE